MAPLGDLDLDGVPDVAVGSSGNTSEDSVWILFLNADGSVKADQRIAACFPSAEYAEAIRAFLEKRPAKFR